MSPLLPSITGIDKLLSLQIFPLGLTHSKQPVKVYCRHKTVLPGYFLCSWASPVSASDSTGEQMWRHFTGRLGDKPLLFRCRNQTLSFRLQFTVGDGGSPASQEVQSRATKCQSLQCADFSLPEYEMFDSASLQDMGPLCFKILKTLLGLCPLESPNGRKQLLSAPNAHLCPPLATQ